MNLNIHIIAALCAWAAAQLIKTIADIIKTRSFDPYRLVGAGGMPSSHSSTVTALSASVGIAEGFDSAVFAICVTLSFIVMYDAAGVRRAAGHQAAVINKIVEQIEARGHIIDDKLKELLGHSPFEVIAGAILGILIGTAVSFV